MGKVALAQVEVDVYRVGNLLRPPQRFLLVGQCCVHLLRAPQKELIALHLHAVGVGAELTRVDAEQHVLGDCIFLIHVVGIAGGDQRQPHPVGDLHGRVFRLPLNLQAVVLDLDEVAIAEHLVKPAGYVTGGDDLFLGLPRRYRATTLD